MALDGVRLSHRIDVGPVRYCVCPAWGTTVLVVVLEHSDCAALDAGMNELIPMEDARQLGAWKQACERLVPAPKKRGDAPCAV